MSQRPIRKALVSVYDKSGLAPLLAALHQSGCTFISTGGTAAFIVSLGYSCEAVEALTGYPSILDGRVKTLHPKVFGAILAKREAAHLAQLVQYEIPEIDCVIVDLYPFEATVAATNDEQEIIEKIDIGGISLIRAAAKNFTDVVCVARQSSYTTLTNWLTEQAGQITLAQRQQLATDAFAVSSHYDTAIHAWMAEQSELPNPVFKRSVLAGTPLRYGENPHQQATFFGDLDQMFETLNGKALSYNNLVDVDSAVQLMREFSPDKPTFAILKHTNACGCASSTTLLEAWQAALAADPISAFGGVLICNTMVDVVTAEAINALFYEVLIAPAYQPEALALLVSKKQRIVLRQKSDVQQATSFKNLLNGIIVQDTNADIETLALSKVATVVQPTAEQLDDLLFAVKCVKHLKSNGIAIVKNGQLLTMGCGQTSRVDALEHALAKAKHFGLDIKGAVMASEAFFPFPDCVDIAHRAGILSVIQPGGSVKDQDSIDYCNSVGMSMLMTGIRHFKH